MPPAAPAIVLYAQAAPPDACALLTADDLQSVISVPFSTGQGQAFPTTSICDFASDPSSVVHLGVTPGETPGETPASFTLLASVSCTGDAIDGIADAACGDPAGQIYFLKNGVRVYVAYTGVFRQRDDTLAVTRSLATLAASRL